MIPTLLLIGLLVGRWKAVLVGAVAWAAVLSIFGTVGWSGAVAAVVVGAANVAVGVLVRQAIRLGLRRPRTIS